MTPSELEDDQPTPVVRWFRPFISTSHLDLLPTPVSSSSSESGKWVALTESESAECERRWQSLDDEVKRALELSGNLTEEKVAHEEHEMENNVDAPEDGETSVNEVGVGIGKEKLFEVNVSRMRLLPIYWKYTGPPLKVRRVTWFYDEHHPVDDLLSSELERAYMKVQPWRSTYSDELSTALSLGIEAYDKLKQTLRLREEQFDVLFESEWVARLISNTATSRISSTLLYPFRKTTSQHPLPPGTLIYRGFEKVIERTTSSRSRSPTPPSDRETPIIEEGKMRNGKQRGQTTKIGVGDEEHSEVTDLILIIHGIGQGMAASWEAFNFLYATNLMRQVALKQMAHPALSSIMRSRRIQFLPVLWRANLKLTTDEERMRKERENEGFSNNFTLEDITLNNKIPFVRDVMNNVLIDVPYFMSHHRQRMIETVSAQANRIYKLWCARNPHFDRHGRVHIIAHSLGSALAAHILSNQPTLHPALSSMSDSDLENMRDLFVFNTSSLFMVGSPLGIFLHLNQAQLIARKGRERTTNSPSDEALERQGVFGCLAVDSVYNIFNASDPIAYRLNPAVDSEQGRVMLPSAIPSISGIAINSLSTRITRLFGGTFSSSLPKKRSNLDTVSRPSSRPRTTAKVDSGFELGAPNEQFTGTVAERRFMALNPHGTVDFYLPSEGNISEYIDMLTAHSSYWADPNFAAFVLSEICARREDLMRTGLGPTNSSTNKK